MKKRAISLLLCILMTFALLPGCALVSGGGLDEAMDIFMQAVVSGDTTAAEAIMYPGVDHSAMISELDHAHSRWAGTEEYHFELVSINITGSIGKTERKAKYAVDSGGLTYYADIGWERAGNSEGIVYFEIYTDQKIMKNPVSA